MPTTEFEELRRLYEEEKRQREEEQRRREEEQRRREEEQRRREEEQRRREEEQRRREEVEELAKSARQQKLQQYLEACHLLDLSIQVVTDRSSTTQGDTTNPTGRIFPRRIIPWHDFAEKQEAIWEKLSGSSKFSSQAIFPSETQLAYVRSDLEGVSSEFGLRHFERQVVESAVRRLVNEAYSDPIIRKNLGLRGTVSFESHTNLEVSSESVSTSMEQSSISEGDLHGASSTRPQPQKRRHHRVKGKGNSANQFCIYRTSDQPNIPVLAIEYKAPHKLSVDEMTTGLASEIQPVRDIIGKDGRDNARALAAAVITQLFSDMVGKGLHFGYICTGELFIFLHIPDDPSTAYFSMCVPSLDVMDDDENRLHRTAVAQVFAFVIQALSAEPPPESWYDEVVKLDTWNVEYDDILSRIPSSEKKRKETSPSPYKPQRWTGFSRSPIKTRSGRQLTQTRSGCLPLDPLQGQSHNDDDSDDSPSPSPHPSAKRNKPVVSAESKLGGTVSHQNSGKHQSQNVQQGQVTKVGIEHRPFCTQKCLLGLQNGRHLDWNCPNVEYHGEGHISLDRFLFLIRAQLATDRGSDADCKCLYLTGARGALFKVRLTSHGYTLVAKGMQTFDQTHLKHERTVYNKLQPLQGIHVPVCLGTITLEKPCHFDGRTYTCFLFLSWAGRTLSRCIDLLTREGVVEMVTTALRELHKLGVLHGDAVPRNMVYDASSGSIMLIDFDRSTFHDRQALGPISLNTLGRKKKRRLHGKREGDEFVQEMQATIDAIESQA